MIVYRRNLARLFPQYYCLIKLCENLLVMSASSAEQRAYEC